MGLAGCGLLACLLTACSATRDPREVHSRAEPYQPTNSAGIELLPASVQRVVLLPAYYAQGDAGFLAEVDATMQRELTLTRDFEVVSVSRDALYQRFGERQLSVINPLPPDLLDHLIQRYDADAVVFAEVTAFEPYKPIAIGLRLRLVSLENGQSLWAFDHLFNAGDPRVLAGARQFTELRNSSPFPLDTAHGTFQSPRRFANYCTALAFSTLPPRQPDPLSPIGQAPDLVPAGQSR